MNHAQQREFLIRRLLEESPRYAGMEIPAAQEEQRQLLRALMNVRPPAPVDEAFLTVQDAYLQEAAAEKGITALEDLRPVTDGVYLWRGDITTLRCDAIVNAANSGMTGCYQPCHSCIDNCIHTYAGIQLRNACARLMEEQGHEEPTGQAKITPAYNLPCRYVIHTVGPIVSGRLTERHEALLASCYRACLDMAAQNRCESIAFCCISTGVFGYPQQEAARTAIRTVQEWCSETGSSMKIIFNVFKPEDEGIYRALLGG